MDPQNEHWAQATLREIALEGIRERRRARRWGLVFKFLVLAYLVAVLLLAVPSLWRSGEIASTGTHTAVVRLEGAIAADSAASADRMIQGLETAFEAPDVAGVILRIDSPGGSPVQSRRINSAILRLREQHPNIPLYAVAGDMAASGAYYVAAAADRIYADPGSLIGSIGVIMGGFGFTDIMKRFGIERRLYTAGKNKAMLDPFSATDPSVEAHVQAMLDEIHHQFIAAVKSGRGDRLADDPRLFSGLVWTGTRAQELGLVDGLASPGEVARNVIGTERAVDYTPRGSLIEQVADRFGVTAVGLLEKFAGPRLR